MTITVQPNQSMSDVIIQAVGSMEGGMQFCEDNGVSISDVPVVGTVYVVSDLSLALSKGAGTAALQYIAQNDITIGTLGVAPAGLGCTVVLYPVMQGLAANPAVPSGAGFWDYTISAAAGFVNVNALASGDFPGDPNPVSYQYVDVYVATPVAAGSVNEYATATMSGKSIEYHIPYAAGHTDCIVWSDLGSSPYTVTFADVNGNEAYAAPLVFLHTNTQHVDAFLIPELTVAVVSSTPSECTLRLTRSHPSLQAPITSVAMAWLYAGVGGTADPLDPTNADKTIVVLGPGLHTLGVSAQYTDSGDGVGFPASAMSMVVEIA